MSSPEHKKVSDTELVAPNKSTVKMVKIRAKHPIRVMKDGYEDVIQPGNVVEVTEEEAKEFCERPFHLGFRDEAGNITSSVKPVTVIRAEKV